MHWINKRQKKMKFKITRPVLIGVSVYKKGDEIELEESEAKRYGKTLEKISEEEKPLIKSKTKNDRPKRLKRIPKNHRK